ncbi:MAG TPA: SRPBCC family protein [Acidimicrobiales bacterium]|nr:SRPBCC family protein [Acidimicrobiales bacterium]
MTNLASLWSNGPWSPVEVRAELPAPPEEVFEVLADPETYPDWLVGAQRIRRVDSDFPAPGSKFEHSVGASPEAAVDDETEALAAEPPHRLDLQVHAGPFHGVVDFAIEPGPAGTSRICFREATTGPLALLTPLLRPIVYARNGRSLKRLAHYLQTA